MHLLAVDWDYFFPTPDAGGPDYGHPELFGWPVAEDMHHTEVVWEERAARFRAAGVELPNVSGWHGFWDRFAFAEGAVLIYADSNAWAGQLWPSNIGGEGAWESVHLYDAHHDAGYKLNHDSFEDWQTSGDGIRCENWMLAHAWAGAALHVHFPPWRRSLGHPHEEPLVPVDMAIDDGTAPPVVFDAVYLCRSGAWVPPWADDAFTKFLRAAPVPKHMHPQNVWQHPRPDPGRTVVLRQTLEAGVEGVAKRARHRG
ncbi:hypothetical protein ACIP5N_27550 [Streptomyces sp. NPDC088768]|uniref:hypothetical protein n=1 Tax=Streptomyces sp. NPDC088768 TaxID=3365894 RepID=UPI003809E9CE